MDGVRTAAPSGTGGAAGGIGEALVALAAGSAAVLPTESGYLLVGTGGASDRLRGLARARGLRVDDVVEGTEGVLGRLEECGTPARGVQRRVVARLTPGPVVFVPGGETSGVRAPADAAARSVLMRLGGGVRAVGVELVEGPGRPVRGAEEAAAMIAGWGERGFAVVDGGPSRYRDLATVVELRSGTGGRGAGIRVVREGAFETRFVMKQAERTILFVCTGNTCRSPMAEAIAVDAVKSGGDGVGAVQVLSAGVGAERGHPATPEAVEALRELGIDPARHSSRPLTRQLIESADAVFAMTRSHRRAVLEIDPGAEGKVELIDPAGEDVPDPIGHDQDVYTETARRLREMIRARLKEMDA